MLFRGPYIATPPAVTPRWTRTSAGTTLAIDLDTVKDFVNRPREDTFWDTEITSFIKVATAEIEKECSLALTASLRRQEADLRAVQRGELTPRRFLERHAWSPYRQLVAAMGAPRE